MNKTVLKKAALVLSVFALLFSAPAYAKSSSNGLSQLEALNASLAKLSSRMQHRPPMAYVAFCRRYTNECQSGGPGAIRYSKKLLATLYATNRSINRKIRYRAEKRDIWSVNTTVGDCEDYALTKRSELIKKGVPAGALRMAVVKTRSGIGHAVLVVHTSRGDLVLDNRRSSIRTRRGSGYTYLKMATSNPRKWISML